MLNQQFTPRQLVLKVPVCTKVILAVKPIVAHVLLEHEPLSSPDRCITTVYVQFDQYEVKSIQRVCAPPNIYTYKNIAKLFCNTAVWGR